MCGLCLSLAAGRFSTGVAAEEGATKIALGHHRDDMVETVFLNMFHGGRLKAMPPKLLTDDRRHICNSAPWPIVLKKISPNMPATASFR